MANRAVIYAVKDAIIRSPNRGSGHDPHGTSGVEAGEEERSLIDFQALSSSVPVGATSFLYLHRSASHTGHDTPDTHAQLIPGRITAAWAEGKVGADHLYGTGNAVVWAGPAVTHELSARGDQPAAADWWKINVSDIVDDWVGGSAQRGIRLRGATTAFVVFDSTQGPADKKPYIESTWGDDAGNHPPAKSATITVTRGADGKSFSASAPYSDPDGDTSSKAEWIFTPDPGDQS